VWVDEWKGGGVRGGDEVNNTLIKEAMKTDTILKTVSH
jgi:hypothetical protein